MKLSKGRVGASVGIAAAVGALVIGGIAFAGHGSGPSTRPGILVDDRGPAPTATHTEGPDDNDHHGVWPTATDGMDDHGRDATEGPDDRGHHDANEGPDDSGHHDATGVDNDDNHRGRGTCESATDCRRGADHPED